MPTMRICKLVLLSAYLSRKAGSKYSNLLGLFQGFVATYFWLMDLHQCV
jgi:hypothetical protein